MLGATKKIGLLVILLLSLQTTAFAISSSSNYSLDFGGVVTGSQNFKSANYEVQSGPTPIATNSYSANNQLMTINLLPLCGDGLINSGEECDGGNLNGKTCLDYGFDSGSLSCSATCTIITTACVDDEEPDDGGGPILLKKCGDGKVNRPSEECDDGNKKDGDGCSAKCKIEHGVADDDDDEVGDDDEGADDDDEPADDDEEPADDEDTDDDDDEVDDDEPADDELIEEELVEDTDYQGDIESYGEISDGWQIQAVIPSTEIPDEFDQFCLPVEKGTFTIDETLFLADFLRPTEKYTLALFDSQSNLLEQKEVETDQNGNFIAEFSELYENGTYIVQAKNVDDELVETYTFHLDIRQDDSLELVSLGDNHQIETNYKKTIDLGALNNSKKLDLNGKAEPGARLFAYLEGSQIFVKTVFIDKTGEFEINLPENLEAGDYKLHLLQVLPNKTMSKNLSYKFTLEEERGYSIWSLALLLALILLALANCGGFITKDSFKKIMSLFGLALILSVVPMQSSAFANAPQALVYEGRLLDSSGAVITAPQTFRFSFWSSADKLPGDIDGVTGLIVPTAANYSLWQEEQTVTPNANGTFSLRLGDVTPLPDIDYTVHKYLQVEVMPAGSLPTDYELLDPTGDNGADAEDRKTIGSVPYALNTEAAQYSNEEGFVIDNDDTILNAGTGSVELQFGDTLGKILSYDTDNSYFNFNDNVNIEGDLTLTGTINGVDITTLSGAPEDKALVFTAEYSGSTLQADGGGDNRGKMQVGYVNAGLTDKRNFYLWTTRQAAMQDMDIVLSVKLPKDFDHFNAAPLTINYKTSNGDNLVNSVDVFLYDTNGLAVPLTGGSALASGTWDSANITFGGAPVFTANNTITLRIKLSTTSAGYAQVSDVIFNYTTT